MASALLGVEIDSTGVAPGQAVLQPIGDSFSHRVVARRGGKPVLMVADQLSKLLLSGCLGPAARLLDDPLAAWRISNGDGCGPPLPRAVPIQTAVTAARSAGHEAALDSRSRMPTESAIAEAGISRERPWVTERRRPVRIRR